ncbi:GntR family transcriptional regulator [Amycolatopsis cihanbeyliensis]|uniref:GntR family transcriptional regulator n=1 Tax=Amycolatopsis cihanbeyliensis TaxID=1128664 RepID=A0A542DJK9_AMYCI|nr:GntR family transcriptional regulator [Amycolatopsis cihanbeyliensis]TQJ03256.1 GntR family transcriptional regulator [Amycolatopsis cihanbeyliensis]
MERVDAKAVAANLRAAIQRGEFGPGEPLPTNEELRQTYECGKNTVSAAIQLLKGEGLLTGGGGERVRVRVAPTVIHRSNERYQVEKDLVRASEEERRGGGVAELDSGVQVGALNKNTTTYEVKNPPPDIAKALELSVESYVLHRVYLRQHKEGEGFSRTLSYIPYYVVKDFPPLLDANNEPWPGGTLHQLYTAGVEVAKIIDHVSARMPTGEEIELFDIPFNVPVMPIRKISYDTTGRAVEVTDMLTPADRLNLTYVTNLELWEE